MEPDSPLQEVQTQPEPKQHHATVVSPGLLQDLHRVKRAVPYLCVLLVLATIYGVAHYATTLAIGSNPQWKKVAVQPNRVGLSPQTVSFTASDGVPLKAWWERPWTVTHAKGTIILVHGSQMNKSGMAFIAGRLLPQGFNVLIPDLRGHGDSGGDYTTFGYRESLDVLAAIEWTRQQSGAGRIGLLGYSAGAVASLLAASQSSDVIAVAADSAYIDAREVLRNEVRYLNGPSIQAAVPWSHRMKLWLFTSPGFSNVVEGVFRIRTGVPLEPTEEDVLASVHKLGKVNVLYLAAEHDPVVPTIVTDKLYQATPSANRRLVFQPGAYHSALAGNWKRYIETVTSFFDESFGTKPASAADAESQNPNL